MTNVFGDLAGLDPGWLVAGGPEADVAVSTRARLARNLDKLPFPHQAGEVELGAIAADLMSRLVKLAQFDAGWRLDLANLEAVQRLALQEKMLVPAGMSATPEGRGVVMAPDLGACALINSADHLQLQFYEPGFAPENALDAALDLDTSLEAEIETAFSPEWGYLTASPTDLGTGLQLSALLHLPGLVLVGEIERVLNALRQLQFSVKGLFGQGNAVRGALFQISNLVSLGRDEAEIAQDFRIHVGKIITYERSARNQLHGRDHLGLEDMVHRSRALLANARLMTAQEGFDCLSQVRLGESLGLLPVMPAGSLNRLTVRQQTGHLELAADRHLSGREKGAARAALFREFFAAI